MRHCCLLLLVGLLLWPVLGESATYYISPSTGTPAGDNSRSCATATNPATPKRTLNNVGGNGGISCLSAGDTLVLRDRKSVV